MPNLAPGTYPAFFEGYVRFIDADTIAETMEKYSSSITAFFKNIPPEKVNDRYAAGKWNLKEMLQHIIDAERIFAYRALTIARHDKTPLPGFDENEYAGVSNADKRTWISLLEEFEAVRKSTDALLQSFTHDQLQQNGTTNNKPNTTEAISFVIYGHILHHINIIKEKYL